MSKYIDAERLQTEIRKMRREKPFCDDSSLLAYLHGLSKIESLVDSLQQEPIEKDKDVEKLIVCDIMEATIARINEGKVDKEKEENLMMEKITYLRNLGLKEK